jgi:hypothetical protein
MKRVFERLKLFIMRAGRAIGDAVIGRMKWRLLQGKKKSLQF